MEKTIAERAESVLKSLEGRDKASEIHKVGTFRTVASLLLQAKGGVDEKNAHTILDKLEKDVMAFLGLK